MTYVAPTRNQGQRPAMSTFEQFGERRSGYRFRYQLPIRIDSGDSKWIDAETRDVSGGGFLLFSAENLPTGAEIEYIVSLPDFRSMKLRCMGKVLRSSPMLDGGNELAISVSSCLPEDNDIPEKSQAVGHS